MLEYTISLVLSILLVDEQLQQLFKTHQLASGVAINIPCQQI